MRSRLPIGTRAETAVAMAAKLAHPVGLVRTIRTVPNRTVGCAPRDRLPLRAGGPRPRALRDLAALRDRGEPRLPAGPGTPRDARAVGRHGARPPGRPGSLAARGGRARCGLPAGLRASASRAPPA